MSVAGSRVLVTGASGFLGAYVVRELKDHGHEVFAHGRRIDALAQVADAEHRIVGELSALAELDLSVDAVIHCAALSSPWGRWRDFQAANVDGTAGVIEFARRNRVRRIVSVSSPSVYAAPRDRLQIKEDDVDPGNRLNGYIRSKIAAERLLQDARGAGMFPELVVVRPRGLIGIGDTSLVPRLLAVHARVGVPIFDGGENLVDLTAVENVATALRLALNHGDADGGIYNITNGEPRQFGDLLRMLLSLMGEQPRLRAMRRRPAWVLASALEAVCAVLPTRPEPPLTRYTLSTIAYSQTLDIGRAGRELGYRPIVSLDEALARVAVHLRSGA